MSTQRISLWRNRDYLLLVSGQTISSMGTEVSDLAYILLVLALTGSPAQVGFVGALEAAPVLILSMPAGALIDRWDRKRVMIFCDMARAIVLASIPVAFAIGHLTLVQIYITALLEPTFGVFFDLAERACLPQMVPREQLPNVSSQNQAIGYTAALLGPTLSGALYSVGRLFPFLVDAISYVASVVSLLFIQTPFQEERRSAPQKLRVEIKEGFLWLWHHPLLRFMTLLIGSLNLTVAGIYLVMVVLAQNLHASSFTIGLIFGIASIGGIAGAFIGPFIQKRLSYGQAIIGICWLTALIWPLLALAPNLLVLTLFFALYLIWGRIMSVVNFSYRMALTPDEMRGRSSGIGNLLVRGSLPIGIALTGILIQDMGVVATVFIISGCRVLIALAATLNADVRNAPPAVKAQVE
ncbi:MAG TPA: MFS transporter [Ktedonobacteraceae bacterium]|nr:MFS transporter [Ktedonobacteraceae bacterium]